MLRSLNKNIEQMEENFDDAIEEILEREEFICSGNACGADAGIL